MMLSVIYISFFYGRKKYKTRKKKDINHYLLMVFISPQQASFSLSLSLLLRVTYSIDNTLVRCLFLPYFFLSSFSFFLKQQCQRRTPLGGKKKAME